MAEDTHEMHRIVCPRLAGAPPYPSDPTSRVPLYIPLGSSYCWPARTGGTHHYGTTVRCAHGDGLDRPGHHGGNKGPRPLHHRREEPAGGALASARRQVLAKVVLFFYYFSLSGLHVLSLGNSSVSALFPKKVFFSPARMADGAVRRGGSRSSSTRR